MLGRLPDSSSDGLVGVDDIRGTWKGATAIGGVVEEAERGVEACGSPSRFGWEGAAGRHGAAGRSLPGWSFASDDSQAI